MITGLAASLLSKLAGSLSEDLSQALPGHCLRVDDLGESDALAVARLLESGSDTDVVARVWEKVGEGRISYEAAVELRNRKAVKLCLLVPPGSGGAGASSLANSFAQFDLERFFERAATSLIDELPTSIPAMVVEIKSRLRGQATTCPNVDPSCRNSREQPTEGTAGRELWRVGLIPDAGENAQFRLTQNYRAASALLRPTKPQSSVDERLANTGVEAGEVRRTCGTDPGGQSPAARRVAPATS